MPEFISVLRRHIPSAVHLALLVTTQLSRTTNQPRRQGHSKKVKAAYVQKRCICYWYHLRGNAIIEISYVVSQSQRD